jgi:Mor family transcriptional regulator
MVCYYWFMSKLAGARLQAIRDKQKQRRIEIWLQYIAGATTKDLAKRYKVTRSQIYNILNVAETEQYAKV